MSDTENDPEVQPAPESNYLTDSDNTDTPDETEEEDNEDTGP